VSSMVAAARRPQHEQQQHEQQQLQQHQWAVFDHDSASYMHRVPPLPLLQIPELFGADDAADDRAAAAAASDDDYCTEPSPLFPHEFVGEGEGCSVLPTPRNIAADDAQVRALEFCRKHSGLEYLLS